MWNVLEEGILTPNDHQNICDLGTREKEERELLK
jgi:hypothetical protein